MQQNTSSSVMERPAGPAAPAVERVAAARAAVSGLTVDDLDAEAVEVGLLALVADALGVLGRRLLDGAVGEPALTASIAALHRVETRAHAEKLRRIAEADARQSFSGRARSTAAGVAADLGLSGGEARRVTEVARALERLPRTAARLRDGDLGAGHAVEAAGQLAELDRLRVVGVGLPADAAARLDALAAGAGAGEDRFGLRRRAQDWLAAEAPDALADRQRRAWRHRGALLARKAEGGWRVEGDLCELGGAHLSAALAPLARPSGRDDARAYPQRLADALVDLARRALDAGSLPEVAAQRPHVLLVVTPETLHAEPGAAPARLDGAGPVAAETARQVCCDADLTVVSTTRNRDVLDVGHADGGPSKTQRLAVIARDRRCIGCGAPASRCQIHHVRYRSHGGATVVDNLVLVCFACHSNIHHFGWTVHHEAGGWVARAPLPAHGHHRRHTD